MAASQGRGQLVLLVHTPGSPAKYTDPEVARSYGTDLGPLPPAALEKRRRVLRALEAADLVCANSSWTASVYRRTYGPWLKDFPPVCSESVGVDIDVEQASPLRGEFVLLSIVRAKPRKRCEGLWSAASALRARGVPYLWRVLCGRHRDEVEADAAHAGATGFRFHGCLSDSEVDAHLRTAHLFVHPAHAEHLGLGILEALVRGVPVVASRSGGPPTYLRDGVEATFFQPDDWGDLAARICEALGAPERGEAGRQLVRQRFSWCSVVQRVKRALEKSP